MLAAVSLIILGVIAASFFNYIQIKRLQQLTQNQIERRKLQQVLKALQITERSQRGYLLTGDERYLKGYASARDLILQQTPAGFGDLILLKVEEMEQTLTLYKGGRKEEALTLVRTHRGWEISEKLIPLIEGVIQTSFIQEKIIQHDINLLSVFLQVATTALLVLTLIFGILIYFHLIKQIQETADQVILESERKIFRTLNSISDAAFILDSNYRIVYTNNQWELFFQKDLVDVKEKLLWEVIPQIQGTFVEQNYRKAMQDREVVTFESKGLHLESTFFKVKLIPIEEGGLGVFLHDITQSLKLEKERADFVQRLEVQVAKRTQELQQSNRDLERFAYIASHDLQEPLRMVSSYLELVKLRYTDSLPEEAQEFMGFAYDGAVRMKNLITDLLEFSRAGRNVDPTKRTSFFLAWGEVKQILTNRIQETDTEIVLDVPSDTFFKMSKEHLSLVLQNLISNSIKYQPKGNKPIVKISSVREAEYQVLSVEDNGIGIDSKFHDKLFVLFKRLHSHTKFPGTGIGLAIIHRILEAYGGTVSIESQPKGVKFVLKVPHEPPKSTSH